MTGNRHYWTSDYMSHRRADWTASLRMYSERTVAARCVNQQGKRNAREADGVVSLYLRGQPSYASVFASWNFHALAGMTNELDVPLLTCPRKHDGTDNYKRV